MDAKLTCGFVMAGIGLVLCLSKKTAPLGFLAMAGAVFFLLGAVPEVVNSVG